MNQLTTLDASFLHAEDADPRANLAIGGLAVIDGPIPDHDLLMSTLARRIGRCPRFAQRIRLRPFNLGAPQWVEDPRFDIAHHVRRVALPRPGTDQELLRVVADVMSWRLDRSRPLWEIWVIEGLVDNRWAMLMKVHHCIADGIAATHMLAGLSDSGIDDSFARRIRAAKEAAEESETKSRVTVPSLNPLTWVSGLWRTSASVAAGVAHGARGAGELAVGLMRASSTSPLNGPITSLRRYSAARVSLGDVKQVCQEFDVTLNDVALAALTDSYRSLLTRRGEQLLPDSLRTLVPVSMRSAASFDKTDNRVSVMLPCLPVEEESAVQRLRLVHSRLSKTKAGGQHQAGNTFVSLANAIPFALTAPAVRLLTRLPQRGVATLATNVPGPRERLQILGHTVTAVMPVPPIAMRLRTGVAILSYADDLFFGILADFDAVPDIDELARGVEAAVGRLVASSKRRQRRREQRRLSLVVSA
ncbi:WS/DGAT/MGAT family O-acyltransferase [Mycobacterium xenopi]|uniref:Diacylglycerol O-acyltransferase n=1 Tax=Mycobacterium xenopi TaxID=1789 RepID=A0AAD1GYG7_MYCXE|nr:wax ester/triacylglycerol synthase family O-acyltransferase [Mycobacterium xenopi]MDA3638831.1 wax ester/triacylglycerol synthase family O-acyltransferase [Mycobacterium xenopi]MDA3657063.1 wax ester/triacylglycerol synthase family O-acyltransferase [Mycobacterium xenopi]MDA3662210.1 wax ester/triacylglycerol synthase family O-acyltransferase [Mycobacterium xenopi]ORX22072.1 diacylglycerol O-acyltransferase [Mycobacterium xenopi]SPX93514.1 triacylglycerol synthase [Mycobacterium xenopi]